MGGVSSLRGGEAALGIVVRMFWEGFDREVRAAKWKVGGGRIEEGGGRIEDSGFRIED